MGTLLIAGVAYATGQQGFGPLATFQDFHGVYVKGEGVDSSVSVSVFYASGGLIKACGPVGSGQYPCSYSQLTALAPLSGPLPVGDYKVVVVKMGYSALLTLTVAPPQTTTATTPHTTPHTTPTTDPPLIFVRAPEISEKHPLVGEKVTGYSGDWTNAVSYDLDWFMCTSDRTDTCTQVGSGGSYTTRVADIGRFLGLRVTFHGANISGIRWADFVGPIAMGVVEPIVVDNSGAHVRGWVCNVRPGASQVRIYLYAPAGAARSAFLGTVSNTQATEAAVDTACAAPNGTPLRFDFTIPQNTRMWSPGAPLYVYSFDVTGAPVLLPGSGSIVVPSTVFHGHVDGVSTVNGVPHLQGWACVEQGSARISILAYVGYPGRWQFLAQGWNDAPAEPVINDICKAAPGTAQRFDFVIPDDVRMHFGSAPIYVSAGPFTVPGSAAVPATTIMGSVDGWTWIGNVPHLRGWACARGLTQPLLVGATLPNGDAYWATSNNNFGDLSLPCNTPKGTAYYFDIAFTDAMRAKYRGQRVTVRATDIVSFNVVVPSVVLVP